MFFQEQEQRARHAFIDASIENAREQLLHPEVQRSLGEKAVRLHTQIMDLLYVPNVRHGQLTLPKDINNNHIPVVALSPDEQLTVDKRISLQMPIQTEKSYKRMNNWAFEYDKRGFLESFGANGRHVRERPLTVSGSSERWAVVKNAHRTHGHDLPETGKSVGRLYATRPVLVYGYRPGQPRITPGVVIHESEHLKQMIFEPIHHLRSREDFRRYRLQNELGAYARQARCMIGLAASGYEPLPNEQLDYRVDHQGRPISFVMEVDALRRSTNAYSADAFFPNDTLRAELKQRNLEFIYTPRKELLT